MLQLSLKMSGQCLKESVGEATMKYLESMCINLHLVAEARSLLKHTRICKKISFHTQSIASVSSIIPEVLWLNHWESDVNDCSRPLFSP